MESEIAESKASRPQSVTRSRKWLTLVDSLVAGLEAGRPLTFVIGAGASLSSNGPTTEQVEQQWLSALSFSDAEALRQGITELGDQQKIDPIRPLFKSVKPFIGYHCLASLARERPILVLNLNWDDALEQACDSMSVPFKKLSVNVDGNLPPEEATAFKNALDAESREPGVYCLYVHGRLDDPESSIRFGLYDTLKFSNSVEELLHTHFFTHPVVVVGASLQGEYDVIDLFRSLTRGSSVPVSPFYIFSRQEERKESPSDGLMQNVLFTRKSGPNFRGDPAVDFDRLMLDLATRLKGIEFARPIGGGPEIVRHGPEMIPRLEWLAIPSSKVLGFPSDFAAQHAVVIEGDASIGKTDAALLLAHLAHLCEAEPPEITFFSGPTQCSDGLKKFLEAKHEPGRPQRMMILEDPFGEGATFVSNSDFCTYFNEYLEQRPADSAKTPPTRVIVTTRASKWRRGFAKAELNEGVSLRRVSVSDWYKNDELEAYLQSRVGNDALIRREIHKRELATPMAIEEALADSTVGRKTMVAEKVAFLKSQSREAKEYVLLARLQELWPNGMSVPPLHEQEKAHLYDEVSLLLRKKTLDGRCYIVPAHSADREAIDQFFEKNEKTFSDWLEKEGDRCGDPRPACQLWRAVGELRKGKLTRMKELEKGVRRDWGPMFMGEAARVGNKKEVKALVIEVMECLQSDEEQSEWALRELVFETIRLWPLLRKEKKAQEFLDTILEDNPRMGRYLVVESMLYVQAATYPNTWDLSAYAEVWDKLAAARHELLHDSKKNSFELAMLFDAFTWCPPRLEQNELRRWLEPLIEAAGECSPMATAIQFSCFYHAEGAEFLRSKGIEGIYTNAVEQRLSKADAEAAAKMIRWHFIHQSRVRAMLYRRDMEPLHAHLITRVPTSDAEALSPEVAENCARMVRALAEFPDHAGWAVHLAMSIATTRTGFDPGCVSHVIRGLKKADVGLITGVLTYRVPEPLVAPVVDYFTDKTNRRALLDALSKPPVVDRVSVGPPEYCAARPPKHVYEILREHWTPLVKEGFPADDELEFQKLVHTAAREVRVEAAKAAKRRKSSKKASGLSDRAIRDAVETMVRGDLRTLTEIAQREVSEKGVDPLTLEQKMFEYLSVLAQKAEDRYREKGNGP